jgi:diguanylate cyclase (GGDEF)-like protein/PAS domain S-box-containing protein
MQLRRGVLWLCTVLMLSALPSGVHARDMVNASLKAPSIDLSPALEKIETGEAQISIKTPQAKGPDALMNLEAKGPGLATHRWTIVSLMNPDPVPHDLVLEVPHQNFGGSGLIWPLQQGSRIYSVQHSGVILLTALNSAGVDAYSFRIEPGAAETFAFEMTEAGGHNVRLYQRGAYDQMQGRALFNGGMLLGIAALVAMAMGIAMVARYKLSLLAGTVFCAAGLLFVAAQVDCLPGLAGVVLSNPLQAPRVAAFSESLLSAGVVLLVLSLIDLRHTFRQARHVLLIVASMMIALAFYGLVAPALASALARVMFLLTSCAGLALSLLHVRQEGAARLPAFLFAGVTAWALLAGVALFMPTGAILSNALPMLLVGIMLLTLMVLFQPLLGMGMGEVRFEDSGRRALALAGAGQIVWDWQTERKYLHVGPELERALSLSGGALARAGGMGFVEAMHPSDKVAYLAALENAEGRGRGHFTQSFRLKKRDGKYRWFMLRARAMPGANGKAARLIGALTDVTDQRQSEDRILSDAVNDRVTGLPNRALFLDRLDSALKRAQSQTEGRLGLHVMVIDIDRFKTVNDGLGHETGDSLLAVTGRRLQQAIGPDDTLARLFGDQFVVLLNATRPQRSMSVFIENLRRAISRPVALKPRDVFLTASFGVVAVNDPKRDAYSVLKDAEIALYEAKRRGKDQVEFYRPDMGDGRSELLSLEQDLRRALERNEMEVLYQPICKLKTQELAGLEALIRWHHPTAGEIMPDRFLPVAESTGLIRELGAFVLNEAGRQLGIWQRAYRPDTPLFVSVNVSSSQLLSTELVEEVASLMQREDLQRGSLRIEVTEAVLMQNPELGAELIRRLKDLGAGVACDDFGTGFSSLSMLRRLPFDTLKIDRSFVSTEQPDERAPVILEAIVKLAHDLGMVSVAEGIERRDQLEKLVQLRCELGQGYFFGEPMSARKVGERLSGAGHLRSFSSRIASFAWTHILGARKAGEAAPVAPSPLAGAADGAAVRRPVRAPMPVRTPVSARERPVRNTDASTAPVRPSTRVRPQQTAMLRLGPDQNANDLLVAFQALVARHNKPKDGEGGET